MGWTMRHPSNQMRAPSQEAHDAIRKGSARIAIVIPPDFHRRKLRESGAQILVLIDGSDSTVSAQALEQSTQRD